MSRPARPARYDKPTSATLVRLLPAVWSLEDVTDVELLCHGVLAEVKPREPRTWADEQDDLAYLFEKVVVIHSRYRPDLFPGILFRPWLYVQLRQRLQDKYRHEEGRHRDKPRPDSLDAPAFSDGDAGEDRLGGLVAGSPGSHHDDWAPACGGLLALGDRPGFGDAARNGDGAHPPDRDRDRGAAAWRDCPACGWRNYLASPNGRPDWHQPEECASCGATLALSGRLRSLAGDLQAVVPSPETRAA